MQTETVISDTPSSANSSLTEINCLLCHYDVMLLVFYNMYCNGLILPGLLSLNAFKS